MSDNGIINIAEHAEEQRTLRTAEAAGFEHVITVVIDIALTPQGPAVAKGVIASCKACGAAVFMALWEKHGATHVTIEDVPTMDEVNATARESMSEWAKNKEQMLLDGMRTPGVDD